MCIRDRSIYSEQFNHHPGQLMMNTGLPLFGSPSVGSWLNYGLGSESRNLPGYVVLTAGRGSSGGTSNWTSGFLPSTYAGVLFRGKGEPILNLDNPPGLDANLQRASLDALRDLNNQRYKETLDPEIQSRIASYELAYRMQKSAPELIDLRAESKATLEQYGVGRKDISNAGRGGGKNVFSNFSTNCLLARRMVERGVRFINIYHASWDHHSNLEPELRYNATMADQPVAALIKDLKQRGLLDETLVVWGSEFGRTPLGENRGGRSANTGRDHHPFSFSIFMAGGGIKGGQVVGATDDVGWHAVKDRMHIIDFDAGGEVEVKLRRKGNNDTPWLLPPKESDTRLIWTANGGKAATTRAYTRGASVDDVCMWLHDERGGTCAAYAGLLGLATWKRKDEERTGCNGASKP